MPCRRSVIRNLNSPSQQLANGLRPLLSGVTLLNLDRIPTTDCAAPHYSGIHTNVNLVILGRCAEDSRISWEMSLRESGHDTTPARAGDIQANLISDCERVADPGILRKAFFT